MVDALGRRLKLSDSTSRQHLFPVLWLDEKIGFLVCNHFRYKHEALQHLNAAGSERDAAKRGRWPHQFNRPEMTNGDAERPYCSCDSGGGREWSVLLVESVNTIARNASRALSHYVLSETASDNEFENYLWMSIRGAKCEQSGNRSG